MTGDDFAARLRAQAERFGVEVLPAQEVTSVAADGASRSVTTGEESVFLTRFAEHVTVVTRHSALSASAEVVRKLVENDRISIVTDASRPASSPTGPVG